MTMTVPQRIVMVLILTVLNPMLVIIAQFTYCSLLASR
jgi:hypothetical protein